MQARLAGGRLGSHVLAWLCVLVAINQLGFGAVVAVLALYARSFGVGQSAIGASIAVYGLARFLVAVPTGRLADLGSRRAVLALGGVFSGAGNVLCAFAPTYSLFLAGRFLAGAGAGLVLIGGQIVLADITTPSDRGRTMAIYHGVFIFAAGIGPVPGGLLAERLGLAAPFTVYAVMGALGAIVAWLVIPETRRAEHATLAPETAMPLGAQMRLLTSHAGFMLVCLITFANAMARTGALFSVVPVLAHDRLALSPDRIGVGLSLASMVGLLVVYPSGVLVDTYGRKSVIVPATFASGAVLVMFVLAPSYGWFLAACAAWSLAVGISGVAPSAYAADVAPPGMNATAMSTYRMLGDVGYVVGPLALGLITDLSGVNAALATAAVLLAAVAMLFARYAPEGYRAWGASTGPSKPP